ncbi:MAG: hypothetical protein HQL55_16640 [Magnetococcales bacterium]|nr:hypothetical protein [Magnetococcales bacterium]
MPKSAAPEKGELVSVRVSPKTKFSLELLSRIQRRTVSAIVHMAIERELRRDGSRLNLDEGDNAEMADNWPGRREENESYLPDLLWDPIVSDRLVKLAQNRPDLLTHQEQLMWKAIQENPRWYRAGTPDLLAIRSAWAEINRQAEEWERLG